MTRSRSGVGAFPTVAVLALIASTGAASAAESVGAVRGVGAVGTATADEPALVSPTTLLAVIAAVLLGLLIVAAVRRADR
jgi:hypothetical protein